MLNYIPTITVNGSDFFSLNVHLLCTVQSGIEAHQGLQQAWALIYDVPSALEVLLIGTYCCLAKCIEDMGIQMALAREDLKSPLPKMDTLLRSRLLDVSHPKEISNVMVFDGIVVLCVD
eukprot:Gb_28142 [translate_table: standard]